MTNAFVSRARGVLLVAAIAGAGGLRAQTQDFSDVNTMTQAVNGTPYFLELETAFYRGLTSGANILNGQYQFAPNSVVTRGQAAVFVIRGIFSAITGDGENFTAPGGQAFTDVPPTDPYYRYIQEMSSMGLGITSGASDCGGTSPTYCENDSVTHEQLAVFFVRAWMIINHYNTAVPAHQLLNVAGMPAPCFENYCSPTHQPDFYNIQSSDIFYTWIETAYFLLGYGLTATCSTQTNYFCEGVGGPRAQVILDMVDGAWGQQAVGLVSDAHVKPIVSGLSPGSGPAGATITITGAGFGPSQGFSSVAFNGVAAQVTSWSNNSISVIVPAGASTGPVTVTGTGSLGTITSTSPANFTVSSTQDYTLRAPPSFTMPTGGGANFITFATPIGGFSPTGGVILSSSASGGIPSTLSPEPGANGFVNVGGDILGLDAQSVSPGNYSVTISGNGGGIQHQISVPLSVVSAPAPVASIAAPSALHTNIALLPIDLYDYNHAPPTVSTHFAASCPGASSVRACYQAAFANFHQQHVTGVRFFFLICGGFVPGTTITALHGCGNPWQQVTSPDPSGNGDGSNPWIQNLKNFYTDLAGQGITNVTPTMSHGDTTGSQTLTPGPSPNGVGCPGQPSQMLFRPGEPYGESSPGVPYSGANFNDYNCAASNPIFVGWQNLDNVAAAVIRTASNAGVTVSEFDLEQELNVATYPVQARLIYDNAQWQTGANPQCCVYDELLAVQTIMGKYYPQNNVVTWSGPDIQRRVSNVDCGDVYGGYARLLLMDEIAQVINNGEFGFPFNPSNQNNLTCAGTLCSNGTNESHDQCANNGASPLNQSPVYHAQPAVVDVHTYPCLADFATGGCVVSDAGANVQGEATNVFNAVSNFLSLTGNQTATVVVGETHTTANNGCVRAKCPGCSAPVCSPLPLTTTCDLHAPMDAAWLTVQGFNQSSLAGHSVVFRPFLNLPGDTNCYFPAANQRLNPNNQGPFTPSQQ